MKKSLILFFVSLLISGFVFSQEQVTISGKITKPVGKNALVFYYTNSMSNQPVVHKADLDESGNFSMQFKLEKPIPVTFRHGRETTAMYIYPGDDIQVSLNPKNFDESIKYEGTTSGVSASNFLAAQYLKFENVYVNDNKENIVKTLSANEYLNTMEGIKQMKDNFLSEYIAKTPLSKTFVEYYQTSELYKWASQLYNYKGYHAYLNKKINP